MRSSRGLPLKERRQLAECAVGVLHERYNILPRIIAVPDKTIAGVEGLSFLDFSTGPTGTHKDILAEYFLSALWHRMETGKGGLSFSLITSGSAGIAIAYAVHLINIAISKVLSPYFSIPPLKCLVDEGIHGSYRMALEVLGAEVFPINLSAGELSSRDILRETHNEEGVDLTLWWRNQVLHFYTNPYAVPIRGALHAHTQKTGNNPKNIWCPSGTGLLSGAFMMGAPHASVFGATTQDPQSEAEKLYAPHQPLDADVLPRPNRELTPASLVPMQLSSEVLSSSSQHYGTFLFEGRYLDEAMRLSRKLYEQGLLPVLPEPSACAGLALFLQALEENRDQMEKMTHLIVSTGRTHFPTSQ